MHQNMTISLINKPTMTQDVQLELCMSDQSYLENIKVTGMFAENVVSRQDLP